MMLFGNYPDLNKTLNENNFPLDNQNISHQDNHDSVSSCSKLWISIRTDTSISGEFISVLDSRTKNNLVQRVRARTESLQQAIGREDEVGLQTLRHLPGWLDTEK